MAPVTLGLGGHGTPSGEVKVGFRSGWLKSFGLKVGSAGLIGIVLAAMALAKQQPTQVFALLANWGVVWVLALAAMFLLWDLAKEGLKYLGILAEGVKETAVAMNRLADKDDRERDRMLTETAYISQSVRRMSERHEDWKDEQRDHNRRVEEMLKGIRDGAGR